MVNTWVKWFCFAWMPLYLGGGGGRSSTTTETTSTSTQASLEDNASGVFGNNNVVTDSGAVKQAVTLAGDALKNGVTMFDMANDAKSADYGALLKVTGTAFEKMLTFGEKTQANAAALVDTANSKGTLDNRTIAILGLGVAALVAVMVWKG